MEHVVKAVLSGSSCLSSEGDKPFKLVAVIGKVSQPQ